MATPLVRGVLTLALAGATALPVSAQRRELALTMAATYTGATGPLLEKTSGKMGFMAGIQLRLPRSARFSFQSEFLVVHRRLIGERAPSSLPPSLVGPEADFARLTYLEVPLMLRFQRAYSLDAPIRPFLVVGPSVSVRIGCSREIRESATVVRAATCREPGFAPALYQDLDVALQFGGGVEFRRVALSIRGTRSFRNLVDPSALPTSPFDGAKLWSVFAGVDVMARWF